MDRSDKAMKKASAITNNSTETAILSVSPAHEDHGALENIFRQHYFASSRTAKKFKLVKSSRLEWAKNLLQTDHIPIAISECDLRPGTWRELLEQTANMPHLPLLIVTSRLADERLWSEVLNEGGYDVLAKPFDHTEVIRVVESAWRQWTNQHDVPATQPRRTPYLTIHANS
jgi:DNA-binding NtrC family response regulator